MGELTIGINIGTYRGLAVALGTSGLGGGVSDKLCVDV